AGGGTRRGGEQSGDAEQAEGAAPPAGEREDRVRQIRERLPGQVVLERTDAARALYGPLYERGEIERRIGETLPSRWGRARTARLELIEEYDGDLIPADALIKFDDAERTGLFS